MIVALLILFLLVVSHDLDAQVEANRSYDCGNWLPDWFWTFGEPDAGSNQTSDGKLTRKHTRMTPNDQAEAPEPR